MKKIALFLVFILLISIPAGNISTKPFVRDTQALGMLIDTEPVTSTEAISRVETEKTITGEISATDNVDYIKFIPEENGFYEIFAEKAENTIDMSCEMFSEEYIDNTDINYGYMPVMSTAGISVKNKWSYNLQAGKTYTLKLSAAKTWINNQVTQHSGTYSVTIKKNHDVTENVKRQRYNNPVLAKGMTPIYWDENSNIVRITDPDDPKLTDTTWHDYTAGTNKWANAELKDGSMFVWIPRYAYRKSLNDNDFIIKFLKGTGNIAYEDNTAVKTVDEARDKYDYLLHTDFTSTDNNNVKKEYEGIWVSKLHSNGEITAKVGKSNSKWGIFTWISNIIRYFFKRGTPDKAEENQAQIYRLENSELCVVECLSQTLSNNNKTISNEKTDFITKDTYKINANQSSTKNIYGVYDMNTVEGICEPRSAIWVNNNEPQQEEAYVPQFIDSGNLLTNPYHGYMPTADYYLDSRFDIKIATALLHWDKIQPDNANQIDYNYIDQKIYRAQCEAKGGTVVIRIVLDHDGISSALHMEIPAWLYNQMESEAVGSAGTRYANEYIDDGITPKINFAPNYENPILIEAHDNLLKLLGERYNDDPTISYIQLGSLGRCAEWNNGIFTFPNDELAGKYVRPYVKYFSNKQLLMRRPHTSGAKYNTGLYNDMIGVDYSTDEQILRYKYGYLDTFLNNGETPDTYQPAMPYFWEASPSSGETGYGGMIKWYTDENKGLLISQIKESHLSFFGMTTDINNDTAQEKANINEIKNVMGYRLLVSNIEAADIFVKNSEQNISLTWENKGAAPFYFDWDAEISLLDTNGNLKAVLATVNPAISRCFPNDRYSHNLKLDIPQNLSSGRYKLAVAILSPYTKQPAISLANDTGLGNYNNRHSLKYINIQ